MKIYKYICMTYELKNHHHHQNNNKIYIYIKIINL